MELAGLAVPTPTLFDANGDLDPARNAAFLEGLTAAGVDHLFVLGSVGEFASVSDPERSALLKAAEPALRARTDLWVGVGAPATRRAVAYAREAEAARADALVAVPPYYLRPTDSSIVAYYRTIHAAVGVPLLAYNIPSKVGYALSVEVVHRLAREGTVVGVKDTSGSMASLSGFLRGAPDGFTVFPGDDVLASRAVAAGASGAVMGTANVVPTLAVELVAAARSGDRGRAARLQEVVDRLASVVHEGPFPSTLKFLAHRWRGAPEGYRSPYDPLTPAEEERVLAAFHALDAELAPYR